MFKKYQSCAFLHRALIPVVFIPHFILNSVYTFFYQYVKLTLRKVDLTKSGNYVQIITTSL